MPTCSEALTVVPAPDVYTHSCSRAHSDTHTLQIPALRAGGRAGALHGESAPPPAPWGLLQMPGVILSLDQWMTFGDTGLGAAGSGDEGPVLWCLVMERDLRVQGGQLGQGGGPP